MTLIEFITESLRIEGINRPPTDAEVGAHEDFLALDEIRVSDLENLVHICAGASLRERLGMNVYVGNHHPPEGGPVIPLKLKGLLFDLHQGDRSPYSIHCEYETIHPFTDGNGRSGRALWAWQMKLLGRDPFALGFLWAWYYQSLEASQVRAV